MELQELVELWRKTRDQRLELDAISKKLKLHEDDLRSQIVLWLDAQGLESARTRAGMVTKTTKDHLEIVDHDAFGKLIFKRMQDAQADGRPLFDGLLLQRTPLKTGIKELVYSELGLGDKETCTDEQFNKVANTFGIKRVSDVDISFSNR